MSITLENYEAEECIEALEQSIINLGLELNNMHSRQVQTIKAIKKIITTQEDLAKSIQTKLWEN